MRSFIFSLAFLTAVFGTMISAEAASAGSENTAQTIANSLKQSGQLVDYRVGVKCEDGVAWLTGTVTSQTQKEIAEQLARNCQGVQHVVSKLEVEGQADALVETASKETFVQQQMPVQRQGLQRQGNPRTRQNNMPRPYARTAAMPQGRPAPQQQRQPQQRVNQAQYGQGQPGMAPAPMGPRPPMGGGQSVNYENPQMPGYAWPSYAANSNYAALTYPKQYSASAWPYIGPFYPYPQVPLGWRKVSLEWDDGWWNLDFAD